MMTAMESQLKLETKGVLQWAKQVRDSEYLDPSKHWFYRLFRIKKLRQTGNYERANAVIYLIENCGAKVTFLQARNIVLREFMEDEDFWNGVNAKCIEMRNRIPLEFRQVDNNNLH
jgi:hypothetical protein